jgi:two-component system OmpR family sensor kinase
VKRNGSLRARLFLAIGAIVVLSGAITLGLGLVLTRRAVQDATLKDLDHQAALIVGEERSALSPLTHLPELRPYLARQHERYLLDPKVLPPGAQSKLERARTVTGSITLAGTAYYYAAHPVVSGRAFILLRPKRLTGTRWTPFVEAIVIAGLAGGLLAAVAAWFLARRITRPVARVAAASRSLTGGRHPEPVPVEGPAELSTLAVAFNDLAEQLARAREAERSFLLSVSHELKTPLTAIAGYAEALREGVVDAEDAAATVMAEAERLERLVGDLLDLARMNRTDFSVHPSDIDLAEVAEDAVRRYQQQAAGFGVSLAAVSDGPAPAVADADRVLQVVSNLVENALRLTPPGGTVRVVTAAGQVRVEDTGPGLREEDRERAFERFYLHSRYGAERPVGTGLGLAIVKELAEAMGGRVEVASEPNHLTVFTVQLGATVGEQQGVYRLDPV